LRFVGSAKKQLQTFNQQIEVFCKQQMDKGRLDRYFDGLLAPLESGAGDRERENRRQSLQRLHVNFSDDRNTLPGMRGSLWAALNAATEFADHQRRFRGTDDLARKENRLDSIWFGTSNEFKQKAYGSALQLVGLN